MRYDVRGLFWTFVFGIGLTGCGSEKPAPVSVASNLAVVSSIDPAAGSGNEGMLTAHLSTPAGKTIQEVRVLLSAELDGRNACYVYYSKTNSGFRLVDDSGTNSRGAGEGPKVIENSQCALDISRSSAQVDGSTVTLILSLKFKTAFVGKKQVFLYTETSDGGNSGLIPRGTWSVTF